MPPPPHVPPPPWSLNPVAAPAEFVELVQHQVPAIEGRYAAQLLWQRGIRDRLTLTGFLDPACYTPTSPFAFGPEMDWAIARLQQARDRAETVAIWGDFDADGITATAVLWEGLGQFWRQGTDLLYFIPNRLTASHGLSQSGIDQLHRQNCRLIVTCDTGSTNPTEIAYAQSLGIDVIVTDHHTLPSTRPAVVAIINPRSLPADHPLASLSGVAVAYKLVEALYATLPDIPQQPLEALLDLVAIGLIADLVELKGDSRYLAQRGIAQLQTHLQPSSTPPTRPGIARLLELCKRTGDRPTDISFGIGPRINAVSRIQGDAQFCVELLTSRDVARCRQLAEATELANARRQALQREVMQQVTVKLGELDLSTTQAIVLWDEAWHPGVLGLVAGQLAQTYGRPVLLFNTPTPDPLDPSPLLARGSARSVNGIDLYLLLQTQAHLIHQFGGHPLAAGLSLPVENLPLFAAAINQQLGRDHGGIGGGAIAIDLVVPVQALGRDLFQSLKLLEPCGMGNPVPKLLIENGWFEQVVTRKIKDLRGRKVEYVHTRFALWDEDATAGFPGVWWGHYGQEIPSGRCDVVVELDYHQRQYEIRLIAIRPTQAQAIPPIQPIDRLLDWRQGEPCPPAAPALKLATCPADWAELHRWAQRARGEQKPLAIAYPAPSPRSPQAVWQTLVGLAKYLSRTGEPVTPSQLQARLGIGDRSWQAGLRALTSLGFTWISQESGGHFTWQASVGLEPEGEIGPLQTFLTTVQAEDFQRHYFYQVPLQTLETVLHPLSEGVKPEFSLPH